MNVYYKNYTDVELANYAANLPFQDDIVYELAARLEERVKEEQLTLLKKTKHHK